MDFAHGRVGFVQGGKKLGVSILVLVDFAHGLVRRVKRIGKSVSILVLVDFAHGPGPLIWREKAENQVSILVLVDFAHGPHE